MHEKTERFDEAECLSERLRELVAKSAPYLDRKEAAAFVNDALNLPCTRSQLEKLACVGGGPEYQLFGNRAVYKPLKLVAWVIGRLKAPQKTTSEGAR